MLYGLLLTAAAVGALLWWTTHRLATLDSRCERAFADIDVQLKHRHALLPNLLATVKAFQSHELAALELVTRARDSALAATEEGARRRAEQELSLGLARLVGDATAIPQLQSSDHFRALCNDIAGAELKIAGARRFLNAAVAEYNAALRQFPGNIVARWLNSYHRRSFYDIGVERALLDEPTALEF